MEMFYTVIIVVVTQTHTSVKFYYILKIGEFYHQFISKTVENAEIKLK